VDQGFVGVGFLVLSCFRTFCLCLSLILFRVAFFGFMVVVGVRRYSNCRIAKDGRKMGAITHRNALSDSDFAHLNMVTVRICRGM